MWELALGGGILVVVLVVGAVVILGLKALDRARDEDVPAVTDMLMRVLRLVQSRMIPAPYRPVDQPRTEEGGLR